MKTSNKIITGFLVLIFLVPVLVLLSFNSKIKKGEFTVVKNDNYNSAYSRSGSFSSFKTVKISGAQNNKLKVNIRRSDTLSYNYHLYSNDSVKVFNSADTLFIQYVGKPREENEFNPNQDVLSFDLNVPVIEHLVLENAEANILFADPATGLAAEIYGSGKLNLGDISRGPEAKTAPASAPVQWRQLVVKTSGAELALGKNTSIGLLNLEADGPATITIKEGAVIDNIQGRISDSSSVNASWKYVKMLALLTGN